MSTTPPHDTKTEEFTVYAHLADDLIDRATKDQLADVARLLALNIGWYHQRYGAVPQEELLGMVRAETLNPDARALLLRGMQNLVSALAEVMGVAENGRGDAVHQGSWGGAGIEDRWRSRPSPVMHTHRKRWGSA